MPCPFAMPPGRAPVCAPWRRRRSARAWARQDTTAAAAVMFAAIPSLPRAGLAQLTMRTIDRMDVIDGDSDFEHLRDDDEDGNDHEQEQAHE